MDKTLKFIEKAKEVHGGYYSYDKTVYIRSKQKVIITCPEHGDFEMTPNNHVSNRMGCRQCGYKRERQVKQFKDFDDFLAKAKEVHGDKYIYYRDDNFKSSSPITIVCKEHGEFTVKSANNHVTKGYGCKQCTLERKYRFKTKKDLSDYLKIEEIFILTAPPYTLDTKIDFMLDGAIITRQLKNLTRQKNPSVLVPIASREKRIPRVTNLDDLIALYESDSSTTSYTIGSHLGRLTDDEKIGFLAYRGRQIHGRDTYDYSRAIWAGALSPLEIICKKHGSFSQRYEEHINKEMGCPKCGVEKQLKKKDLFYEFNKFKEKFLRKFGDSHIDLKEIESQYVDFSYYTKLMDITCKIHNKKYQATPYGILLSRVCCCPYCIPNSSSIEDKIEKLVVEFYEGEMERHKRFYIGGTRQFKEADFYFPAEKIAIECHGLYWHSDSKLDVSRARNHIKEKYEFFKERGIQCIQLYEDEINNIDECLLSNMIGHKLGYYTGRTYARKTFIRELDKSDAKLFLNENHIQGECTFKVALGCFNEDKKLLAVMCFNYTISNRGSKFDNETWELVRFSANSQVLGGASKLLKTFIRRYNPKTIISYSDNRFSNGDMYSKLGFELDRNVPQDYFYVKGDARIRKSKFKRSSLKSLAEKGLIEFDAELSEIENVKNNGYNRIWDAGKMRWKLTVG